MALVLANHNVAAFCADEGKNLPSLPEWSAAVHKELSIFNTAKGPGTSADFSEKP